jgi:hypothetical protein
MPQLLIMTASFFVLIICLMGVQTCYFRKRWYLFWLLLAGVVLSSGCISIVLYQWYAPTSANDLPDVVRSPTTPL